MIVDQTTAPYQEEIVRQNIVRRFDVETSHCARCRKRWQGRYPLQTSHSLDVAKVQLGAEALTPAARFSKQTGLPYGQAAEVLRVGYGLEVSRGGLCRAIARLARKLRPTYASLLLAVRPSLLVWMDETTWKAAAVLQWLWVAVTPAIIWSTTGCGPTTDLPRLCIRVVCLTRSCVTETWWRPCRRRRRVFR